MPLWRHRGGLDKYSEETCPVWLPRGPDSDAGPRGLVAGKCPMRLFARSAIVLRDTEGQLTMIEILELRIEQEMLSHFMAHRSPWID